jgi:23S rRNA (guanosine2251-2'-O)-methyltransferase
MKKLKLEELGRIAPAEYKDSLKIPVCLVLDNLRSLHNVGSAFRTADAFTIEQIFLTGITGVPPHREIQKTALGATESVPWQHIGSSREAIMRLRAEGYQIILIEQTTLSVPLQEFEWNRNQKYALVFGNEINGVSAEILDLAHHAIEVPQAGSKHSLNVSVCVGVVVWECFRQFRLKEK